MRSLFTKNFMFLLLTMLGVQLTAQNINTLTINSPSGIAGDYTAVRAAFGSTNNTPITANAAFVDDGTVRPTEGCNAITNNVTGLVAFIDRGTCEFGTKALRAENRGAIVAIICNNAANATQDPFSMVPGSQGGSVNIPTFMISYNDCQKIRTDILAGGVNVTLSYKCVSTAEYGDNVVWGKEPGEGDFRNGLNDWQTDNGWEWNPDGNMNRGTFGGTQMMSPSACNGIMEFNGDFLDNSGTCPAPCTGAIISPNIDLTAFNIEGISIEFSQSLRQFLSQYRLVVSKNGGITWPDTVVLNAGTYYTNDFATNHDRVKVALRGYEGVAQIRFKFEIVGNYYYWGIDDVVVINEAPFVDLTVNQNFYAVAPSYKTPASQVADMPFLADIQNLGNQTAENSLLTATVRNATSGEVLAVLENEYPEVLGLGIVENQVFPDAYVPPAVVGAYNVEYEIQATGDSNEANNARDFFFEVTDRTFSKTPSEAQVNAAYFGNVYGNLNYWNGQRYFTVGNAYYVANGNASNGAPYIASKVRYGLQNPLSEVNFSFVRVDIYEWVDLNGDGDASPDERERVGTNFQFIDSDVANLRVIETEVFAADPDGEPIEGQPVRLKSDANYLVLLHSSPLDEANPPMRFLGTDPRSRNDFYRDLYYGATALAYRELGLLRGATTFGERGTSADVAEIDNRTFFAIDFKTAFVELDIDVASSTTDFSNNIKVSTFPNPASRDLFIDLTLEKVSTVVKVDLVGMDGRMVMSKIFENVQDDRLRLDVSTLVAGTYTVLINTEEGAVSRKVVVQK